MNFFNRFTCSLGVMSTGSRGTRSRFQVFGWLHIYFSYEHSIYNPIAYVSTEINFADCDSASPLLILIVSIHREYILSTS